MDHGTRAETDRHDEWAIPIDDGAELMDRELEQTQRSGVCASQGVCIQCQR
jgi:hypothetical protein